MKNIKRLKCTLICTSAAMAILGLFLVIWPYIYAVILCYLFGTIMIVTGIVRIISYIRREVSGFLSWYELPLGLLDILMATVFFLHPQSVMRVLPIIVAFMIMVDSMFNLQRAIDMKRMGLSRWWVILLFSIISVLFALLLMINPFEGSITLIIFIGITLIIDSIQNICVV